MLYHSEVLSHFGSVFPERISFTSKTEDCVLDGSHHVKDFKLDERFLIDVTMTFRWKNPGVGMPGAGAHAAQSTILADGSISVEVREGSGLGVGGLWAANTSVELSDGIG